MTASFPDFADRGARFRWAVVVALGALGFSSLRATTLDDARKALEDGLPQVALYRLQQEKHRDAPDRAAADLLMGEVLFSTGRFDEAIGKLIPLAASEPVAQYWLAESYAALGQPERALPLYRALAREGTFSGRAVIGEARMLHSLWRAGEALELLTARFRANPGEEGIALELAEQALDAGDLALATEALARVASASALANSLRGRVLMAQGAYREARAVFQTIPQWPARLASGLAIALSECQLKTQEPAEAEKPLEAFIEDTPSLPGLGGVFAALDRVYAAQTSPSNTELRRWAEDAADPLRAGFATFYLARNEARAGDVERSRQLFAQFLEKYPGNPLGLAARLELAASLLTAGRAAEAFALVESDAGADAAFLRGRAQAAQGKFADAGANFLEAAEEARIEPEALFNAALCGLLADVPEKQNEGVSRLRALSGGAAALARFEFFAAMRQAARREPDAGRRLAEIASGTSAYAAQARLALAEWDALRLDFPAAHAELQKISNTPDLSPVVEERAGALAVFVADTGEARSGDEVRRLAEAFLKAHPDSRFAPEIHMKLGELYFRGGDYLAARGEFLQIAEKFPDSPLAAKAVFLTAQAMERSMDPATMGEAIALYESVAAAGGPLASRARLAQAMLFNALKKPKDAMGVFERILESRPDPELRATALIEEGETLYAQGEEDPANYQRAIATWKLLADDPSVPRLWSNQALFRTGAAYEKLNQPDAALNAYYEVVSRGPQAVQGASETHAEPEYFWFYKAGFDAAALLKERKLWKEAIAIYEKLAAVDGPRAGEASEQIKKLRLENFLWEE